MTARRRLLLMADAFDNRGGGEVVVAHLAHELRDRWHVAVLSTTRGRTEQVVEDGLPVTRLHSGYHPRLRPLLSFLNPLVLPGVRRVLRTWRPDVVHAWNVHSHLSYDSLRIAHRAGARVVLTYQDAQPFCYSKFKCWLDPAAPALDRPDYRASPRTCRSCRQHYWMLPPRDRLVARWLASYVDHGVSVSRALADALEANGVSARSVVHNGLPLDDRALVDASPPRARSTHGWGDEPLLVTGGRLHHFKGHRLAIEVFGRVAAADPAARLVVLGDRSWFRDALEAQASAAGLRERITFPGFLDRVGYHDVVAAAALFLNLSIYLDPFPTVNLESMALGTPVVGTCFGGTPEAIIDRLTGRIVNPFEVDRVASTVLELLGDRAARDRLGEAGRARVAESFRVQQMASRYEEIYECA